MTVVRYENVILVPNFSKTAQNGETEPIGVGKVSVDFDIGRFARKESKLMNQTEVIESNWRQRTETNPRIYNASKFRLAGIELGSDPDQLGLKVGLTSYKELLGTHYSDVTHLLTKEAAEMFPSSASETDSIFNEYAFMSNAIGVGAICVTTDNFVVLMLRSDWTGEGAGKIDRPGGHPEPLEALKALKNDPSLQEKGKNFEEIYQGLTNQEVLKEIFASPQKELRDEINIELEVQDDPKLLGEIFVADRGGRVGLDFLIKVRLTKSEVLERYARGHQSEADESVGLVFVGVDEIRKWEMEKTTVEKLTPHCLAGLRLFHLLMQENC